jgi:hypothetical protein
MNMKEAGVFKVSSEIDSEAKKGSEGSYHLNRDGSSCINNKTKKTYQTILY